MVKFGPISVIIPTVKNLYKKLIKQFKVFPNTLMSNLVHMFDRV